MNQLSRKARNPKYEPIAAYLRKEIETANDPLFRHFKVARQVNLFEEQAQAVLLGSEDLAEGAAAFVAKRDANFRGR